VVGLEYDIVVILVNAHEVNSRLRQAYVESESWLKDPKTQR
jgi:hypothetical protein